MVVERTRSLTEIKIRGRAEHRGVAGEHRLGEAAARAKRAPDHRKEADLLDGGHGTTIGLTDETAQQSLGVGRRILGHDDIRQRPTLPRFDRKVIEQHGVRRGGPLRRQRAFDIDPAHDEAGLTFGRREGILGAGSTWAGSEETGDVDLDALAGLQIDIEFGDGDVGAQVDSANPTEHARRGERIDRDRLGTTAFADVVEIRNLPARLALGLRGAGPDPYGVAA